MAINGDYPQPVTVNGFSCKNCTDVDYAKKHIDPAHPQDGPYGINAKDHEKPKLSALEDPTARRDWTQPGQALKLQV
ncbi:MULTISPECIES: hypothetical protein [Caulobacter]|uniref:Uncharacterized protein n=1 Tax=Caulobacter vibrioides OR37 TaxID=1292034 RepID=R0EKR3_CAUVI|nr:MULTISPECIES: hypothetical protein [Caulobacter]ENZ82539.1 hypothetical protein OR37_01473 [Caulobacter vibrioides OR37]MBQ1561327.1 hypothetical protein [Caulobacter sp.]